MCDEIVLKTSDLNQDFKNEIFDDALKMKLKSQLKEYNLDENRVECIITNIIYDWKYITPVENLPLPKPDEVYLSYSENNGKYQFKLEVSYLNKDNEWCEAEREFFCEKEDKLIDWVVEYLNDEAIMYINPNTIADNLKARYKTRTETEIIYNEPDEDDEDIPIYDCADCPVCMETFNINVVDITIEDIKKRKRNTYCGHPICFGCFETIANSNKTECPICRADYEDYDIEINTNTTIIDGDYIRELQENLTYENINELIKMVNMEDLALDIVRYDGYEGMLGLDWENWDNGTYVFATFPH